jgi:HD-GYP domain-containing protein (c-di-GMP phosphodiesterase class II)
LSDNSNPQNRMDKFYRQTIDALVAAASERDSIAQAHSERVRDYAVSIAERLDSMSQDDLKNLGYAASLHDIGKVAISGRILNKLGRLTDEEVKIMRQHSLVATRILEKIEGLQDAIPTIKHHHERYDGEGYPDGLAGDQIPVGARIVAVAEAYDILTSDVPWRNALSSETAVQEIERCAGTQFDPEIVSVLRSAIEGLQKRTIH